MEGRSVDYRLRDNPWAERCLRLFFLGMKLPGSVDYAALSPRTRAGLETLALVHERIRVLNGRCPWGA